MLGIVGGVCASSVLLGATCWLGFLVGVLVGLMLCTRDRRRAAPLRAMLWASAVGFVLLLHAFSASDRLALWRYGFAYLTALAYVFVVEIAALDRTPSPAAGVWLHPWLRRVLAASLVVQLVLHARWIAAGLAEAYDGWDHAREFDASPAPAKLEDDRRYRALQAALPPGATLAVMLDAPYHLDFARNPIVYLDLQRR